MENLDVLVEEVLFPAFQEILREKGMTTSLKLEVDGATSRASARYPLVMAVFHNGPMAPRPVPAAPRIAQRFMEEAIAARPVDPDKFTIPSYERKPSPHSDQA